MENRLEIFNVFTIKDYLPEKIFKCIERGCVIGIIINTKFWDDDFLDFKYLTLEEKKRFIKYAKYDDKVNFLISHSMINYLFSSWLNCEIIELPYRKGIFLKPYIDNEYHIKYNISHSREYVILGIYKNEIGVDVEYVNGAVDYKNIVRRFFNKKEVLLTGKSHKDFFKSWVAKEAYLKYLGKGLRKSLSSIYLIGEDENEVYLYDEEYETKVSVKIFKPDKNFIAGICVNIDSKY